MLNITMRSILNLFRLFSILVPLSYGQKLANDYSPQSMPARMVTSNYKTHDSRNQMAEAPSFEEYRKPSNFYNDFDYSPVSISARRVGSNCKTPDKNDKLGKYGTKQGYQKYVSKPSNSKPIQFGKENGAYPRLRKSAPINKDDYDYRQPTRMGGSFMQDRKSEPIQVKSEPIEVKSGPIGVDDYDNDRSIRMGEVQSGPYDIDGYDPRLTIKEGDSFFEYKKYGPIQADDYHPAFPSNGPSHKPDFKYQRELNPKPRIRSGGIKKTAYDYSPTDLGKTNFYYAWALDKLKSERERSVSKPRIRYGGIKFPVDDYRSTEVGKAPVKYNYTPDLFKSAPSASKPFQYPVAKYQNYNFLTPYGIKVGHKLYNYDKNPKSSDYNDDNSNDMDNVVGADVIENKIKM